ncbi:WD40 repeat domain-containing protein [Labrys monachus]|uniref:WD40 repeat protein n=1 Tax=Labrys monachus TaxID=217067 RepID=A0ABU0F850_9HYPH|nr:WD40 repeat domain-containing protein [Labrys monachus]MDQ0390790.1 WD40 repeat protein [Labrys monachus]
MSTTSFPSLSEQVTPVAAGSHVVACSWLGRTPVFASSDGTAVLAGIGEEKRGTLFEDAGLLTAASSRTMLVAGSDDGRIAAIGADGGIAALGEIRGKWIDAVAVAPTGGAVAWSAGKSVHARDDKGVVRSWTAPSSVRGLAFFPKGYRLAISHYNGVSLWFPNASAAPEFYEWKGSHIDVTVSPDARFIVTSMQENTLHGWTVADKKHMRMSGYPSKTRSFSWSHDGNWLATSGADAAIIWPFQAKDGPMGKAPRECGIRHAKVSRVAFHPKALVLAIGYEDGCILLCRLTDASEILVRRSVEGSGITAIAWDATGAQLAFGAEDGAAGILTLPAA